MTHRTSVHPEPTRSGIGSTHHLTRFLSNLKQASSVSSLAKQILHNLIEVAQVPYGSLYLAEHDSTHFTHLCSQGPSHVQEAPPILSLQQTHIHTLTQSQQVIYGSNFTHQKSPMDSADSPLPCLLAESLIVPLIRITTGKLIGFVLLPSTVSTIDFDTDISATLTNMAHIGAAAMDGVLLHEAGHQSNLLRHRTDRLRSLELLAGHFTHAIRNPLTSIKTFIQLAPERTHDTAFFQDFSQLALDDMVRIERLLHEMIDYAKPTRPHRTHEDLNEVLSSCLYFVTLSAGNRRIKIEKDLAPELPRGMVDRQQIKQALFNLLFKAMDALGKEGGMLRVTTTFMTASDGIPHAVIKIEEARAGVSAANLTQTTQQVCPTPLQIIHTEGTELAVADQIIHVHQGEIQVQNTEGIGMTFHISLPLPAAS